MAVNPLLKQLPLAMLIALGFFPVVNAVACGPGSGTGSNLGSEECLASCKRFKESDVRRSACNTVCRTTATSCDAQSTDALPKAQAPTVASLATKKAMVKELEKNAEMLAAIKAGNLNAIRRLIQVQGLSPTYVYAYEYNSQTRQFDGRVTRLRLSDVFADTNTLRSDAAGLDRMLALFLELGMDAKATLTTVVPSDNGKTAMSARTAWGPNLRTMKSARDSAARFRAFEIALQAGLVPNDDFSAWLFAELPQVCGRDRSKFAIQVVDLLIQYLGASLTPSLQDSFWRLNETGPETVSDVLDRAHASRQPTTDYEKKQFALQDDLWEQCAPLSLRINRYLMLGK